MTESGPTSRRPAAAAGGRAELSAGRAVDAADGDRDEPVGGDGGCPCSTLDDLMAGTGSDLNGSVVDSATVGALLCDAGVHRIVTSGASVVLDAGPTGFAVAVFAS